MDFDVLHELQDIRQGHWAAVTGLLLERLNPQTVALWIRPLQELSFADGVLTVTAPDAYHRKWVLEKYGPELTQAVEHVWPGTRFEIVVRTPGGGGEAPDGSAVQSALETESIPEPAPAQALARAQYHPNLDPRYTFESFVVGSSNQVAHASAIAVAQNPGRTFNPLFIAGGAGLGKTHLLNAIGHAVFRADRRKSIQCIPAERFMNEFVSAIQQGTSIAFKEKYRRVDVLLIDDVHTLAGREATQEEFFHIFNSLHDSGRQIVLTSDKYPKDMPNLEERLRSRFEWGLIADIQPPDLETKMAIIGRKAEPLGLTLPEAVRIFLASLPTANVRDLEGYLQRIRAYSEFQGKPVTLENVQEWLAIHMGQAREASCEEIIKKVADYYNVRPVDLKSSSRKASLTQPRHVAMYLTRELTSLSFPDIGQRFGGKNHATVMHGCDNVRNRMHADPQFAAVLNALKRSLR